ncbi:hypothetical protein PCANB_001523 [Pneumocystis canis]|nr:hypothetical protein PCK1_001602 [Pneumocystis canis]KAG5439224.1 hypothetical protein PCANB_001523 [Pneumocystis canis]
MNSYKPFNETEYFEKIKNLHPTMNPNLCFDISYIKNFLRLSRAQLDDSITFHLNSLSIPKPFVSESIKVKPIRSNNSIQPDKKTCISFINQLFNVWEMRSSLIMYCETIANDPNQSISLELQKNVSTPSFNSEIEKYNKLRLILDQEKRIERVVRDHSWEQILKRCELLSLYKTHEIEMQKWASEKNKTTSSKLY